VKKSQRLTNELSTLAKEKQAKENTLDAWRAEGTNFADFQPGPVLEDEFFGGFRHTDQDLSAKERADGRYGDFAQYRQRSPGWAAEMPTGLPPFVLQRLRERDQQRPPVTPEQGRHRRPAPFTQRWRAAMADAFAEDAARLSRNRDKWTHNLLRGYRPSRVLEAKRFPNLKRVQLNPLVTNEYLRRGGDRQSKESMRAEAALWFRQTPIEVFPPEKLAAELRPGPKMGRPTIYDRPLSAAERKASSRAMKIQMRPSPAGAVRPGAAQRLRPPLTAPGFFIPTRGGLIRILGGPSRITPVKGGAYMITPVPTPRDATSSLIGAITIPTMTEVLVELINLDEERARRARAREAKASVLAWRAKRAAATA